MKIDMNEINIDCDKKTKLYLNEKKKRSKLKPD